MKPIRMIYCRAKCILSEEYFNSLHTEDQCQTSSLPPPPPPPPLADGGGGASSASMQMTITCGEELCPIAGGGGGQGGEGGMRVTRQD